MFLIVDNYDSFTYNLVQYFGELGIDPTVTRNDKLSIKELTENPPSHIVISPGPGRPENAGLVPEIIKTLAPIGVPILGVCLGHQAIGYVFGAEIVRAKPVMHGKVSKIEWADSELYQGVENPFTATRYHSLIIKKESLPDSLQVTAWTAEGDIMGIRHKTFPVEGIQFHPESIKTFEGKKILANFTKMVNIK